MKFFSPKNVGKFKCVSISSNCAKLLLLTGKFQRMLVSSFKHIEIYSKIYNFRDILEMCKKMFCKNKFRQKN